MSTIDSLSLENIIEDEAKRLGLPIALAKKVILTGENYDQADIPVGAVSPKGARGAAQVMPSVWDSLVKQGRIDSSANPDDPRDSVKAGLLVLQEQLKAAGGNQAAAVAGYNGGTAARTAIIEGRQAPAAETRNYMKRVGLDKKMFLDDPEPSSMPLSSVSTKGTPKQAEELGGSLEAYLSKQKELTASLAKAMFGTADSRNAQATSLTRYGDAAASAIEAKGGIDVAALLHKTNIANILSSDITNPDTAVAQAQKLRAESQYKMDALRPVIDEESKVQIWDNPLRWIGNQFTLPALKKEYNAAARTDAAMVQRIADTAATADALYKVSSAMVVADIKRNAAATAEATRFKALADAGEAHAAGSSVLAQNILQEGIANDHSLEKRFQFSRLFQESINYKRAVEGDKKTKAEDERLGLMIDTVNTKLAAWKMPALDVPMFKSRGQAAAAELLEWAQYPEYGKGPGDTLLNISKFATPAKVKEADGVLVEFLTKLGVSKEYRDLEAKKKADPKFNSLSSDVQRATVLQDLYQEQQDELSKTGGDNSKLVASNPYKLMHLQTAMMDELKGNSFVKVVGETAALSPDKRTVDDKQLLLAALGKVEAEPASRPIIAKELAEYYTKAAQTQWRKGGAAMTGYPRPTRYGVTDPFGSASTAPLNMQSALEIEAWMSRRMAAKASMIRTPESGSSFADFWNQGLGDLATPFGDPLGINK